MVADSSHMLANTQKARNNVEAQQLLVTVYALGGGFYTRVTQ
jgi:hypothetical protein